MRIKKVKFVNLKSFFGTFSFDFDDNIVFLLGQNGTGKSNFLHSINLLNEDDPIVFKKSANSDSANSDSANSDSKSSDKECSVSLHVDYSSDKESFISFFKKNIKEIFLEYYRFIDLREEEKFINIDENYCSKLFTYFLQNNDVIINCINFEDIVFYSGIDKEGEFEKFIKITVVEKIISELQAKLEQKKWLNEIKSEFLSNNANNEEEFDLLLNDFKIIMIEFIRDALLDGIFINFESSDLRSLLKIIYWRYSDDLIIPSVFKIEENTKDFPTVLSNLFKSIGYDFEKVKKSFYDIGQRNYLEDTTNKKINEFIKKVWPDFYNMNLEMYFRFENWNINIKIKTKNIYNHKDIAYLSDGYKQFLSVLFSIGTNNFVNTLILIDEPEIHLHPSSIVSLRKLLESVAEKNEKSCHLFVTTHSVNLINKDRLDHYYLMETASLGEKCVGSVMKKILEFEVVPNIVKQAMGVDFFADFVYKKNCLIVEGLVDKIIIERIFRKNHMDFVIMIAHGNQADALFECVKQNFGDKYFEENTYILMDVDKNGFENTKKRYIDKGFKECNLIDLFSIFPNARKNETIQIEYLYKNDILKEFIKETQIKDKNLIKDIKSEFCKKQENIDENKALEFCNFFKKIIKSKA